MADPRSSPPPPAVARRRTPRRPLRAPDSSPPATNAHRPGTASRAARRRLILDTLAAMGRSGQTITAARICVSGDVLLLTENQTPLRDEPIEEIDWVTLAGQT